MPTVICTGHPAGFGQATIAEPPPELDPTPFNPGHYILLNVNNTGVTNHVKLGGYSAYSTVLDEIKTKPVIKGLQFRVYWNQFENDVKGSYDWSTLDTIFNDMGNADKVGAGGKRIMIFFALTATAKDPSTGESQYAVPNYMIPSGTNPMAPAGPNPEDDYQGGQFGYVGAGSVGYRVRLANANVQIRMKALLTAMFAKIKTYGNAHLFENFAFSESALGTAAEKYTLPSIDNQFIGLFNCIKHGQTQYPNRQMGLFVNYPRSTMSSPGIDYLVDQMEANKMTLMCPDIFPNETDLWTPPNTNNKNQGVLHKMQSYTGIRCPSIQDQDQWCTAFPTGGTTCNDPVPTYTSNFNVVKTTLNAHYCIWQRSTHDDPNIAGTQPLYQSMYNFLTTGDKTLNTTKPVNSPP